MCIANEQQDRRSRWLRAGANLALVAGLLLWTFARPAGGPSRAWLDGVVGLFMGFSIATNLLLVVKARRCNRTASSI